MPIYGHREAGSEGSQPPFLFPSTKEVMDMHSLLETKKVTVKNPDFTLTLMVSMIITATSKEVLDNVKGTELGRTIGDALQPVGRQD